MTYTTLAWRNLWRNPTRTTLTLISLACSLFLFTMLAATVDCLSDVSAASSKQLRLVVHDRTTVTKLLPLGHRAKLAAIPGVSAVCAMRWFGGRLVNSSEQFPSMAVDADSFPIVFDDFRLNKDELDAWIALRPAAVLGVGLAQRIGCTQGDRVVLAGSVPPYLKLEFRVVGVTRTAAYPNVFVFRLDYLVEALRADPMMPAEHDDAANIFWLRVVSPGELDAVRQQVDDTFANTPDPTRTELEDTFVASFTKMFGDIPALIRRVGVVVLASILLVVCNTMSSNVRERSGELAVLKTLGFTTHGLLLLLFLEAALTGLIGTIGCLLSLLAFGLLDTAGLSMPYFPLITVSPAVAGFGAAVSVLVSLASALPSAWRIARLSVIDTLRRAV